MPDTHASASHPGGKGSSNAIAPTPATMVTTLDRNPIARLCSHGTLTDWPQDRQRFLFAGPSEVFDQNVKQGSPQRGQASGFMSYCLAERWERRRYSFQTHKSSFPAFGLSRGPLTNSISDGSSATECARAVPDSSLCQHLLTQGCPYPSISSTSRISPIMDSTRSRSSDGSLSNQSPDRLMTRTRSPTATTVPFRSTGWRGFTVAHLQIETEQCGRRRYPIQTRSSSVTISLSDATLARSPWGSAAPACARQFTR